MSEWRTPTVIAMCHAIREEKAYVDAPILADKLDDEGYKDQDVLYFLRNAQGNDIELMRQVSIILGGEYEAAVKWLDDFVYEVGMELGSHKWFGYRDLIEHMASGQHIHLGVDTPEVCYDKREQLWEKYKIVMADDPTDSEWTPFTCAC